MKHKNNDITNNIINDNDVPVAGTDLFADSESFLNELTDSELVQINGGAGGGGSSLTVLGCQDYKPSNLSVLLCH